MSGPRDAPTFQVPNQGPRPRPTPSPRRRRPSPWNDLFDELKSRYPKVREPIVAALATLMQDPDIDPEHAKAVAAANGIRITAASIAGAQRVLARRGYGAGGRAPDGQGLLPRRGWSGLRGGLSPKVTRAKAALANSAPSAICLTALH